MSLKPPADGTTALNGRTFPVDICLYAEPREAAALTIPTSTTTYTFPGSALSSSLTLLLAGLTANLQVAYWNLVWTPNAAGCGARLIVADNGPANIVQVGEVTGSGAATPSNTFTNVTTGIRDALAYTSLQQLRSGFNKNVGHQFKSDGSSIPVVYASRLMMLFAL